MKIAELTGFLLDYWVGKTEGVDVAISDPYPDGSLSAITYYGRDEGGLLDGRSYSPSSHWSDGGPIIERDQIFLSPPRSYHVSGGSNSGWHHVDNWTATVSTSTRTIPLEKPDSKLEHNFGTGPGRGKGPTPLVAAMRAKVASHYGDEVPDDLPTSKESGDE